MGSRVPLFRRKCPVEKTKKNQSKKTFQNFRIVLAHRRPRVHSMCLGVRCCFCVCCGGHRCYHWGRWWRCCDAHGCWGRRPCCTCYRGLTSRRVGRPFTFLLPTPCVSVSDLFRLSLSHTRACDPRPGVMCGCDGCCLVCVLVQVTVCVHEPAQVTPHARSRAVA